MAERDGWSAEVLSSTEGSEVVALVLLVVGLLGNIEVAAVVVEVFSVGIIFRGEGARARSPVPRPASASANLHELLLGVWPGSWRRLFVDVVDGLAEALIYVTSHEWHAWSRGLSPTQWVG